MICAMSLNKMPADEPAHDVLAADEFAVPAPDPELVHHRVVLPEDPSGIVEPHDVLAAEEFPMPAGRVHPAAALAQRAGSRPSSFALLAGAILSFATLRRLRRR
jgi:hypothetical protein